MKKYTITITKTKENKGTLTRFESDGKLDKEMARDLFEHIAREINEASIKWWKLLK